MKLNIQQLIAIPFGYSYNGQSRQFKGRFSKDVGIRIAAVLANANAVNVWFTKTGKVILTVVEYSANPIWDKLQHTIEKTKAKKPAKQLSMKL